MEISREEFVKRYLKKVVRQIGDSEYHTPRAEIEYNLIMNLGVVLLDKEKWEDYTNRFEGLEEMVADYQEAYKELKRKYVDLQRRSGME